MYTDCFFPLKDRVNYYVTVMSLPMPPPPRGGNFIATVYNIGKVLGKF